MTIKIIISNKIINEICNFQIIFTDINNIDSFKNTSESNKIILKNVHSCKDIKELLPPNIDIKFPYASEYYTVNGYKISLLYLTSNFQSNCSELIQKQELFIKEELNKKSDYYVIFVENPNVLDFDYFKNNGLLIVSSSKSIKTTKYNLISLDDNDYIYLEIGEKIRYQYRKVSRHKIQY